MNYTDPSELSTISHNTILCNISFWASNSSKQVSYSNPSKSFPFKVSKTFAFSLNFLLNTSLHSSNFSPLKSATTYSKSGFTAKATLAHKVHGVVVQTTAL